MSERIVLPPGAADCRRFQRYQFTLRAKATIYPTSDAIDQRPKQRSVMTCDLSRGGICFMHSQPLTTGQRVDIELTDGRRFSLSVRRVNRMEDGWYAMGCTFAAIS